MPKLTNYLNFKLISTLLIFFISQCFFMWLTISSFNDFKRVNLENLTVISTEAAAAKIGVITKLGRSLHNYVGAAQEIYDLRLTSQTSEAFILDAEGRIVLGASSRGLTALPVSELHGDRVSAAGSTYCVIPFYDIKGQTAGYIAASLTPAASAQVRADNLPDSFYLRLGLMLTLSLIVCGFFSVRAARRGTSGRFKSFLLPFAAAQILVLSAAVPQVKGLVTDYVSSANVTLAGFVHSQFKQAAALGLTFHDISGIDEYISEVKAKVPAIGYLRVTDENGQWVAGDRTEPEQDRSMPIAGINGIIGYVELQENSALIVNFALKLSLTLFTLFIISAIAAFELSTLTELEAARLTQGRSQIPFETTLPRPISFCLVAAFYLPIAVTPVYMGRFSEDFAGLNPALIRSFAVSTEMLAIGVSSLCLLIFSGRCGRWPQILKTGVTLLALGMAGSWLAPNGYLFLLARFTYGLGYGAVLVSLQLFAAAITSKEERGRGFAALFAGLYSGVLCGGCAGGLIAEKFGQDTVYGLSALLLLLDLLLLSFLFKHRTERLAENTAEPSEQPFDLSRLLTFCLKPQVLSLLFFQAIPYAMITIGFFNFFMPIFITSEGFGTDAAGQLNFLYSLIIIMLTPICGRLMDKMRRRYLLLSLGLLCSAAVPLIFSLPSALTAAILAMLLLGVSASINESGQPLVISTYKAAALVGSNNAVMILDTVLRAGQIAGPLLVAAIFAALGTQALSLLSVLCALLLIIFTAVQQRCIKEES